MERPLLYYATKLVGNEEKALDLMQELWMYVFRNLRRLKDPGSLRPWLYRLIHGIAVDSIRAGVSRERAEDAHAEGFEEAGEPEFTSQDAGAVHQAVDQLDLRHREVLTLHFLEDFSIAEIARIVDSPEGTVKSRIYHAKKEMKEILLRGGYGKQRPQNAR